jgi:hypothetical protein
MDILRRYNTSELRQLAVYLAEFQEYSFVVPANSKIKKCWLSSLNLMLAQKELTNPEQYLRRIRTYIRWFINHKINIRQGMANKNSFYNGIVHGFTRNVTETTIHFKDRSRDSIDIQKSEMILSEDIMVHFTRYPNTLNIRNYYDDERQRPAMWYELIDLDDYDEASNTPQVQNQPELVDLTTSNTNSLDEEVTDATRILECKVCMTNKICIVLTKCGHTFCHTCTTRINNKCATCRTPFTNSTKVRMYI